MYNCEICGKASLRKITINRKVVCRKHYIQFKKYGMFLDTDSRTIHDLNHFVLQNDVAIFDVYDRHSKYVTSFIVDVNDVDRIKHKKWRVDSNKRVITGNCTENNPRYELSRLLVNCVDPNKVVDHINGNSLDNRKENLRVCNQSDNLCNKSFMSNNKTGFIGVYYDSSRNMYSSEITKDGIKYRLGRYILIEHAIYARYIAEKMLFDAFRNTNNDYNIERSIQNIDRNKKEAIEKNITNKILHKK